MKLEPIGRLVGAVHQADPASLGRRWITYLDIACVDNIAKRLTTPQRLVADKAPSRARQVVRANDVLISTVRPNLNAVALVPPSFDGEVASTGFCVLRPRPTELCSQYLFFFAQSAMFVRRLTALATGASYPAVTDADIMEMCIPLPPLREQERIARQLDKADRLRRTRRYTLELSDTFLPAAFLQIFGDPVRNAKSWDVELLEDVCDPKSGIKAGPFGSSLKKEIYSKSGIRIYGQEQVIAGDFSVGDYYISLGMFEEFRSYEVRPGDMLLSLVGTFGKVVVVPEGIERGIINPRLLKISPLRDRLDSVFLKHFIQHPIVQVSLERKSHGGTMGILNAGLLKQVRVIVPPLPMQLQFAKLVARYEHLRAVQRESLRQAEHLFQTLLHSAFASDV